MINRIIDCNSIKFVFNRVAYNEVTYQRFRSKRSEIQAPAMRFSYLK